MSLNPTFALTARHPYYWTANQKQAEVRCYGSDSFYPHPYGFASQYAGDQLFFDGMFAADPALDYSNWTNRKKCRFVLLMCRLQAYGPQKQLALVFGFDVLFAAVNARLLIYSDAGLLQDQTLMHGDNQFLLEVDSLSPPINLYFIHAGGSWFFKGITGYVI
jgi:hypothetical protein